MPIFAMFLLKRGSLCLVCVYIFKPRHTGPPQKGSPSRTSSLLIMATFGPQGAPSSQTHHLRRLPGTGTHF